MQLAAVNVRNMALISVGILLWLSCAFYAGGIARTNGQSYHLWWLIGFLLGPLGLISAFVYFQLSGERHRRLRYSADHKSDMPEMVPCPHCGEFVPLSFDNCQFCGAPLEHKRRS